jgi:hypothetical protein
VAGCPVLLVIVLISISNTGLTSRRSFASFVLSQCKGENSDLAEGLSEDEIDKILSRLVVVSVKDLTVFIAPPSTPSASTPPFFTK